MSFFPVDRDLFTSSIWLTGSLEEKVLWVWLLGNRDDSGVVGHRELAIAFGSGLPRAVVDAALVKFASPDKDSRTEDNDGRRIDRTASGFVRILNHELYRGKDYSTPRWRRWKELKEKTKDLSLTQTVGQRSPTVANGAPTKNKEQEQEHEHQQERTTHDAVASGARAPRPRQLKLSQVQREPFVEEAGLLVKAWVYLVAPSTDTPPPTPGLADALVRLHEARYSKPQRALVVVAATTERYFREMKGLRGLQSALSLGGRPRVKDGVVISHAKNQAEALLNEPRRYGDPARKVLAKLGAIEEATARGWRPE